MALWVISRPRSFTMRTSMPSGRRPSTEGASSAFSKPCLRRSSMSFMTDKPLHGVLPVLQTPFTVDREIDAAVLEREIDWAFEIGSDGVVVGMVSEVLRLSDH